MPIDPLTRLALDLHWSWKHSADDVWINTPRRPWEASGTSGAVLENEVIPEFYDRDAQGIPRAWVERIRRSMAALTPRFSAARTVRQYVEEHYVPAAAAYAARASERAPGFLAWNAFTRPMEPLAAAAFDAGLYTFVARAPAGRPAHEYTARVRPFHPLAVAPETYRIVWQR